MNWRVRLYLQKLRREQPIWKIPKEKLQDTTRYLKRETRQISFLNFCGKKKSFAKGCVMILIRYQNCFFLCFLDGITRNTQVFKLNRNCFAMDDPRNLLDDV